MNTITEQTHAVTARPSTQHYNGFSLAERRRLGAFTTRAIKAGKLTKVHRCHACKRTEGIILTHQEDYRAWGDYFPMCLACHKALHERYRHPHIFEQWIGMLSSGLRPIGFESYDWSRWNRLYLRSPHQWAVEESDGPPELALFHAVSMDYADHVPAVFDRMAGCPYLPGQHHGEVGAGLDPLDDYDIR